VVDGTQSAMARDRIRRSFVKVTSSASVFVTKFPIGRLRDGILRPAPKSTGAGKPVVGKSKFGCVLSTFSLCQVSAIVKCSPGGRKGAVPNLGITYLEVLLEFDRKHFLHCSGTSRMYVVTEKRFHVK
jgi:hypothetical protein